MLSYECKREERDGEERRGEKGREGERSPPGFHSNIQMASSINAIDRTPGSSCSPFIQPQGRLTLALKGPRLWCGGALTPAHANAKGTRAGFPRRATPAPPRLFVTNQKRRAARLTKKAKVQARGGRHRAGERASTFAFLSLRPPSLPNSLCLFFWLSLTVSGLSGAARRRPHH